MSITPATSVAPHCRFLLSRLQREWDRLAVDEQLVAHADSWRLPGLAPGATLGDVLAAAGLRHRSGAPSAALAAEGDERVPGDRVLGALVVVARRDPLAGRVVLQRLLPGLSAVARRRSRYVDDHVRNTDELLGAAWTVICAFPAERRPNFVASALLRAIEHQAFVSGTRRRLVHELVEPQSMDVAVESDELSADPVATLVAVAGALWPNGLHERDAELISALLQADRLRDAARQLHVSERTVRNHRDEMVRRLRDELAA